MLAKALQFLQVEEVDHFVALLLVGLLADVILALVVACWPLRAQ